MTQTPEQIAASLTPAQVRALFQWNNRREILSACPYDIQSSLAELGLIARVRPMLTQATELGRAVLAALDNEATP
jgi:hypothetical protein